MSRSAAAWRWYANMNDDVRHHLVEQGWFAQHHRDADFSNDVEQMQAAPTPPDDPYPYPDPNQTPELDPDFDGLEEDYRFYGQAREEEPDVADFYGEPEPGGYEIEPPEPE